MKLDVLLILLTAWAVLVPRNRLHERVLEGLPESATPDLAA
jgi:hypothetical protein